MSHNPYHIIVIDDEESIQNSIKFCLETEHYSATCFSDSYKALQQMCEQYFDLAIIDIRLKTTNGLDLLKEMRNENIHIPVIFISGNASLDEVAHSLKAGAYDFIEKPFSAEKLLITVKNCLDFYHLKNRLQEIEHSSQNSILLGEHKCMNDLRRDIAKVAKTDSAILISGESGTGKELIAQSIHSNSKRADNHFIKVNCSAIPDNLIESALFGHVKGAFTGADHYKKGYFDMANHGTLFLDEIADMPLESQASLLRVLENKEIQKVGSDQIKKIDVRILAASHKDLNTEVNEGRFRKDLYYRINVIPIHSPSLRQHSSDIPLLANHFINIICERNGFAKKDIDNDCFQIFQNYSWSGNVRELFNVVERMVIMGGDKLRSIDIPSEITLSINHNHCNDDDLTLKEFKQVAEREFIIRKLKQHKGNITKVATALGIDRTNLHKKMSLYNIKRDSFFH